ncbi:patatin-like phospholipase family protein [Actinomycetospora sp.]|uniref:patatin-like phospholipase family protein n=1 Tax=Actinomycetospora sp. TaxID=1872135 RepID=UPI002F3F0BB8
MDLVLQGGGVKGIALGGALDVLLASYDVRRVAGTSAGAIAASLVAAGYTRDELRAALGSLPYAKVPDRALPIPGLGELTGLLSADGLYRGDVIEQWVADRLAEKGVRTFGDLRLPSDSSADPLLYSDDRAYRLVVTATDITRGRGLRLPWDYRAAFGLDPDEQSVAEAVRMSLSIPVYFVPRTLVDVATGRTSRIVDGGVLSNFPVELFDRQDGQRPRWPTLGVGVIPELPGADSTLFPGLPIRLVGPLALVEETIATAISGHDQTYLAQPRNAERVFRIDTDSVGVVDFHIDAQRRATLVANGRRRATEFLDEWNWDDYLKRFFP